MSYNALILAGSRGEADPVAASEGVREKALIEIGGQPMLARVIAAVREAGAERIAVAASPGPVADLARSLGCEVVEAKRGPSESAAAGFAHLGAPMLLTTADHALLKAQWVRDFVEVAQASTDISVMLARRDVIEQAAPGSRRTYLRFSDGEWSGCNLFFFASPRSTQAFDVWRAVEADRKRPWRIVRRLGPGLLLRYLIGRLPLTEAMARLGSLASLTVGVVPARDGLAAVDVDKPDDLAQVRAIIG
jgi:GTP:adenosylcobinamide-phosphate guanylyltransferase